MKVCRSGGCDDFVSKCWALVVDAISNFEPIFKAPSF